MSEFQPTDPSDKQGNKFPSVGEYVGTLLSDETIKNLPENEQGKVIIDRFIGSLVRHGEVQGAVDSYTPDFTLKLISDYMNGKAPNLRAVTSTEGLRAAAISLSSDERTGGLLGHVSELLKTEVNPNTGKEEYTLLTEAQLDGYIDSGGGKNNKYNAGQYEDPTEWIGPFMADVHDVANGHGVWRADSTLANDIRDQGAVTPEYYKRAKELYEARMQAYYAGVDLGVVRRSVEYMHARDEDTKKEAGERALFLATGGKLDRYKQNHKAWFQRHIGRI